jgi:hypothetical protein
MSNRDVWSVSVGLALLYASAFYLPQVGVEWAYWLPAVGWQVLYPALVAILVLTPGAAYFQSRFGVEGAAQAPWT